VKNTPEVQAKVNQDMIVLKAFNQNIDKDNQTSMYKFVEMNASDPIITQTIEQINLTDEQLMASLLRLDMLAHLPDYEPCTCRGIRIYFNDDKKI